MPEESAMGVAKLLPADLVAQILPHLQLNFAAALIKDVDPEVSKAVVHAMEPKRAATLLMRMPREALERLLPHAPQRLKDEARELLVYPEDSVGRIMMTDYLSFRESDTVLDAIRKIRQLASRQFPAS
ncbi:MAG: magnesium transporter [Phycisphaerae bacterium]|nr:magnesium transporter [Phycisphaerae bacterium]